MDAASTSKLSIGASIFGASTQSALLPVVSSILGTAVDVIHAFALVYALVRFDLSPGRLVSSVANVPAIGSSATLCSELCGMLHGFMALNSVLCRLQDYTA